MIWTAPGPGRWEWQGSHVPGVPTPFYSEFHRRTFVASMTMMFERYGVPLRTMDEQVVNGRFYAALQPLIGNAGSKPPPKPILWIATRVHPEFRRRTKSAAHALEARIWRARTQEWHDVLRPKFRTANLALQDENIGAMTDSELADHLRRAHDNAEAGYLLHFDLHGDDIGPLGLFLSRCREWGIEPGDAMTSLAGHSPSTRAPLEELGAIAAHLDDRIPRSLDELRTISTDASDALDRYLREYGWRLVTGYDIDARTVGELPEILLANILACRTTCRHTTGHTNSATTGETTTSDDTTERLRTRVPAGHLGEFDALLTEARIAMDLRDDNGPITAEWTVGLLRRAILEIGRRLVDRGSLRDVGHAVELDVTELHAALTNQPIPDADTVAGRAMARAANTETPPQFIGEPTPPPDLSAFPPALATMTAMAMTATALLERTPSPIVAKSMADDVVATGLGIGTTTYTGTARVAATPEAALATITPGDILVVQFTTPAYNSVLAVCGAVVTAHGGALSHAAVLAREFGITALIGIGTAHAPIPDGATIEINPTIGTLRVVDAAEQDVSGFASSVWHELYESCESPGDGLPDAVDEAVGPGFHNG